MTSITIMLMMTATVTSSSLDYLLYSAVIRMCIFEMVSFALRTSRPLACRTRRRLILLQT
jgi:hypothetical protein